MKDQTQSLGTSVLIVGYGPVGATLGCLLGRLGTDVIIVDKSTHMFMQPRAIALDQDALRVLQMAGLDEAAFARIAIPYVRMRSPIYGQFAQINTAGGIDTHPKLVTFSQPEMETALRQQLQAFPSVRVMTGLELVELTQAADHVHCLVKGPDGVSRTIRSAFVVGADGASSFVRKALKQDFEGSSYAEDWLIVDALDVPAPIDHVEFICDPKRPIPHMPAPGGRERWEFMLAPHEAPEAMQSDESLTALLNPWLGRISPQIERRAVYRFHARCCKQMVVDRVALAGDAAHITPPFVGQGLVSGLRDVANLAWKLDAIVLGHASQAILQSYDTERRPHAKAMIVLARVMGALVMPRSRLRALVIHGAMRLLRLTGPSRRFFEDLGVKPSSRFKRGLFSRGRSIARFRRGAPFPQVWVRGKDGALLRSDDALGQRFALIGFGVDPSACLSPQALAQWRAQGNACVTFCHLSQRLGGEHCYEDIASDLIPATAPIGWVAVVRPDKVVMCDGRHEQVTELLASVQRLLHTPSCATDLKAF